MGRKIIDKESRIKHIYRNKYYNLYCNNIKWTGLNYRQIDYVQRKFWTDGTIACYIIKNIDELGFTPWVKYSHDQYGLPEQIQLINEYASPLVPNKLMTVDKDVVIGYIQSNKKSMKDVVEFYIDKITEVDMVLDTNLNLQKMPFLVGADDTESIKKMQDIIDKVMNNETIVKAINIDPNMITCIQTGVPYIIDKLVNYKRGLENELKTIMGIDNKGEEKIEQLQLAEVNANNAEINSHDDDYLSCLQTFCDNIKETFNIEVSVELNKEKVVADGEYHEFNEKPGPEEIKGDESNEN